VTRFVIFDLFHTLVHSPVRVWERAVAEVAEIFRVQSPALLAAYRQTWRQRQTGWSLEESLLVMADLLGVSPSPAQVAQAATVRRTLAGGVLASTEALPVLDELGAAGYRLGLVSNAAADTAEAWPDSSLAKRFDAAMFSCEVGAMKPDPKIYLAAMTALGARPEECWYVGDGADRELPAASALGLTAVRTRQYHDNDPDWAGLTVTSLAELRGLLPARPA
jgi:putative hydrolase of the HAD superfamily